MKNKNLYAGILILIFVFQLVVPILSEGSSYPAIEEGAFYKWIAFLRVYDPSVGKYEKYWEAMHYLRILNLEEINDVTLKIRVAYSTIYEKVFNSKYTTEDTTDRTVNHRCGSMVFTLQTMVNKYEYVFAEENWGFGLRFPFHPFMFFNVKEHGFKQYFESNYIIGPVAGEIMERGVLFETWDIIMGTKRDVYYAEIYLRTLDMNVSEHGTSVSESSITETNVEIDKQLGIILKIRYFIDFADKMFELIIELADTNMFIKHKFTITMISFIIGLIIIWAVIRYYRGIKRRRLIRI